MRKLIILSVLAISIFSNCERNSNPVGYGDVKFFHPDELSRLSLDHIDDFWEDDSLERISDFVDGHFELNPGHLGSIRLSSKERKVWAVSVFESRQIAIAAMEELRKDTAALVFPGDSSGTSYEQIRDLYWSKDTADRIKDKWWWGIIIFGVAQRSIHINKWNTIIRAGNLRDDLSDSSRLLIEDAAIEIARRVDAKSIPFFK